MKELLKDLPRMAIFSVVAEQGSFTSAVDKLGVSKSVIAEHINQLEKNLGVRLLHRTTRCLTLTESGEEFLKYCRSLLEKAEEGRRITSGSNELISGTIRISTTTHFGSMCLPRILSKFIKQYPDVKIDLEMKNGCVNLIEERFDLAIRQMVGEPEDSSLVTRALCDMPIRIVGAPEYFYRHSSQPSTPNEAVQCRWIRSSWTTKQWTFYDHKNQPCHVELPDDHIVNTAEALKALTLEGLGLAMLPEFSVKNELESGELISVLNDYYIPAMKICALYPSKSHLPKKISTFIEFLRHQLQITFQPMNIDGVSMAAC